MKTRTVPLSMVARRARIAALVSTQQVASQEDLGRLLDAEGIHVTQATLSRDLDALGAVKEHLPNGEVRYSVPSRAAIDTSLPRDDHSLQRIVADTLLRAEAAGNIAVVRTPPGAAQYLAGHLDRNPAFETVGTVAGDDTIIIVMRTPKDAQSLCETLVAMSTGR
jgi:transcriptional regulator of arginine metabolism